MEKYVIDTSSLIFMTQMHPPEIFKTLWETIFKLFESGILFSIENVYWELKDSQKYWANFRKYFRAPTQEELQFTQQIIQDNRFKMFTQYGLKNDSAGLWADPHLISCALANPNVSVITEENSNRHKERKISYVCDELNINYMNFIEFLKLQNIVF